MMNTQHKEFHMLTVIDLASRRASLGHCGARLTFMGQIFSTTRDDNMDAPKTSAAKQPEDWLLTCTESAPTEEDFDEIMWRLLPDASVHAQCRTRKH